MTPILRLCSLPSNYSSLQIRCACHLYCFMYILQSYLMLPFLNCFFPTFALVTYYEGVLRVFFLLHLYQVFPSQFYFHVHVWVVKHNQPPPLDDTQNLYKYNWKVHIHTELFDFSYRGYEMKEHLTYRVLRPESPSTRT